jgi:signal transducing adaptor molecule
VSLRSSLIRSLYLTLSELGFSVQEKQEPAPVEPPSDLLRAEDEELRRVLELSLQDQGGRSSYSSAPSGAGASSTAAPSNPATSTGYAPPSSINKNLPDPSRQGSSSSYSAPAPAAAAAPPPASSTPVASRVRALYDFTPTESGELAFRKGDVLRVLDSVYEHWWRGEVNGEVGIFPVNFVEVLPDPTPADVQREAELEARIFAQANNIDRLLSKLRGLDPARDNLAEDEELQELYQSSLSMRPKIVKLIDRYNSKVSELRSMNEKFVRARSTFDVMMEQSLAKYNPSAQSQDYTNARVDYGNSNTGYAGGSGGPVAQSMSNGSSYQQHAPAVSPGYHPQQQQQQYQQPQGGESPAYSHQQQQEYAQAWAAYYDQQQQQSVASQGAAPPPPQASTTSAPLSAPPNVNDPGYAQWYYSQQQQQQQQQQQPQQYSQQHAATSSASAPAPSGYDYRQGQQQAADTNTLHDQDKRAMFERARAEAEAYHRAHQQHSGSSNVELPLQ